MNGFTFTIDRDNLSGSYILHRKEEETMNKDFDLNLKMEKGSSDNGDGTTRIASIAYCTPGCITGELCGSSECGLTRS